MEIELDFWGLIESLAPLLEEIDRIEAIAAEGADPAGTAAETSDQDPAAKD